MISASEFGEITEVPRSLDEVIWADLEPQFYDDCVSSLNELTNYCRTAQSIPVSFYVGAGISIFRPSKLPDAKTVLRTLFQYCQQKYSPYLDTGVHTLLEEIDRGGYVLMESVLQHLYETIQPHPFGSGSIFNVPSSIKSFNINHLFLARWLQSGSGTVITTNLDPLIEHAWSALLPTEARPHVMKHPANYSDWRNIQEKSNVIWKLHGSADDPATWAITLSKVGFRLDGGRSEFIEHVISQHNTCFVGYRAADLDLFPPILAAQASKKSIDPSIFWVFYFRDGYHTLSDKKRTLEDYLAREPNIRTLYESNPSVFRPIVTTAERLFTWLRLQCWNELTTIPDPQIPVPEFDFTIGLRTDLDTIGFIGASKLVGFTLRTVGKHEKALEFFDRITDTIHKTSNTFDTSTINQIARISLESAHTSFQHGDVHEALRKLERTWILLNDSGEQLLRAWCEFGRVTMTLDARHGISTCDRLSALARLFWLKRWFSKITVFDPQNNSPRLGNGLCLYYELKLMERVLNLSRLVNLPFFRNRLLQGYDTVAKILREEEFLNSLPDVLRRKAFLLTAASPEQAVQQMTESMRVAKVVSQEHYNLACERARLLKELISEPSSKSQLEKFIDQFCP